jgi:hypothetical protein
MVARTAGLIWTVYGCLWFLTAVLLLFFIGLDADLGQFVLRVAFICLIPLVFGAINLCIGVRIMRGTAEVTSFQYFCAFSIIAGLLCVGIGVRILADALHRILADALNLQWWDTAWLAGGAYLFHGIGFLAASVLAFIGHRQYKAWREAQKS